MSQAVIFTDDDMTTDLQITNEKSRVEVCIYTCGHGAGERIALSPSLARELARVLNLFATFAEAEGGSDAEK